MRSFSLRTAAAVMAMAIALPAFAQTSSSSSTASTDVASSADLACMSAAVDARESASITARTTFNASIMAALQTRRDSLHAAYAIANNHDRMVAIQAALNVYAKAIATARAKYKADINAAWSTFATARVNCHIDQDTKVSKSEHEDTNHHDRSDHDNRGLHLGWIKQMTKANASMNASVNASLKSTMKLDLDF